MSAPHFRPSRKQPEQPPIDQSRRAPTNTMLRSVLTLAACLATTAATAPRPALLQLRGGGGVVEEQPKTGKLWVARSVESSPAPMAGAGPSG